MQQKLSYSIITCDWTPFSSFAVLSVIYHSSYDMTLPVVIVGYKVVFLLQLCLLTFLNLSHNESGLFFYCICLTQFFQTCLITKYFISALFSMVHDRVAQILKMFLLASPLLTGTTAKHYKRIVSLQPCHNDWHPDESSLWQ